MQGNWLVSVKSLNASFPQQFTISGATTGNGTYPGNHPDEISVIGANWRISILHNPGSGFERSRMKIKFPTTSGGFRNVSIASDDSGNDGDFNDLVLLCRMPVTANDFLLYGNVSTYAGLCLFNPCQR